MISTRACTVIMTESEFRERYGREPEQDDLHRANCTQAGEFGHMLCGVCPMHCEPRFMCGCVIARDVEPRARESSEIRERVEQALREATSNMLGAPLRVTPSGELGAEEEHAIVAAHIGAAAAAGFRLADGWRLRAELDLPSAMIVLTARRRLPDGTELAVGATDPGVWQRIDAPSNPFG
jgi:hypothetical protein